MQFGVWNDVWEHVWECRGTRGIKAQKRPAVTLLLIITCRAFMICGRADTRSVKEGKCLAAGVQEDVRRVSDGGELAALQNFAMRLLCTIRSVRLQAKPSTCANVECRCYRPHAPCLDAIASLSTQKILISTTWMLRKEVELVRMKPCPCYLDSQGVDSLNSSIEEQPVCTVHAAGFCCALPSEDLKTTTQFFEKVQSLHARVSS